MTPLVDRRPDYDELLRLAEAAQEQVDSGNEWNRQHGDALGDFEAAASPDVVAALIRENRQQAERIERLREAREKARRAFAADGIAAAEKVWPDGVRAIADIAALAAAPVAAGDARLPFRSRFNHNGPHMADEATGDTLLSEACPACRDLLANAPATADAPEATR